MDISPTLVPYLWLIAGALFLLMEAMGVSGIGFLFAGLAALVVGVLVEYGVTEPYGIGQFAWFCALGIFWAIVLWKPIQTVAKRKNSPGYSNMVGDRATVLAPGLEKGKVGRVQWSGTHMDARIDDLAPVTRIDAGTAVIIKAVSGNTLTVSPH